MWPEAKFESRLTPHCHFGLHEEWLKLYLAYPNDWRNRGLLGNRQVDSLRAWLKTGGLHDKRGNETSLAARFHSEGTANLLLWELLWVNIVFSFNTAAWFVYQGNGIYTSSELCLMLSVDAPHFLPRSIHSGILELVGLLEFTPIGAPLNQGRVTRKGKRSIERHGLSSPTPEALNLSLELLFQREGTNSLDTHKKLLFPWVVFGCDEQTVRLLLAGSRKFSWDRNTVRIK